MLGTELRHRSESLDSVPAEGFEFVCLFVCSFCSLTRLELQEQKTHFPLVERLATDLCRSSSGRKRRKQTLTRLLSPVPSARTLEAGVLAFSLGKLSPDRPAAAAGQDGKVGEVLGAEAPGGVAPVGTVPQPAVGTVIQLQQGLLVEQEELQDLSGQDKLPEGLRGGDAGTRLLPTAQLFQASVALGELGWEAVSTLAPVWAVAG